jgi:hypothetical protein
MAEPDLDVDRVDADDLLTKLYELAQIDTDLTWALIVDQDGSIQIEKLPDCQQGLYFEKNIEDEPEAIDQALAWAKEEAL